MMEKSLLELRTCKSQGSIRSPKDGLLYLGDLEISDEALPRELQGDHLGAVVVNPGAGGGTVVDQHWNEREFIL